MILLQVVIVYVQDIIHRVIATHFCMFIEIYKSRIRKITQTKRDNAKFTYHFDNKKFALLTTY